MNERTGNGYTIRQYTSGKIVLDTPDGDSLIQGENHEALLLDLLSLMPPAEIRRVIERAVEMSEPQPKGHTHTQPTAETSDLRPERTHTQPTDQFCVAFADGRDVKEQIFTRQEIVMTLMDPQFGAAPDALSVAESVVNALKPGGHMTYYSRNGHRLLILRAIQEAGYAEN